METHRALCFIPDAREGNVGGGIALTRQVVTTHGPGAPVGCGFWGAGVWQGCIITSHSRNGEKGRKAAGTGAGREHKPLCASHVPVQPRTAPVTSSPAPPRSLITSYLMTNQEELNALLAFPPLEFNSPANGYFEWELCPGHELAQPSGISLGITHSECSETRSYTENAFCLPAQSAFLFQGGPR